MAEQAAKEPTMEEILASIRRIISEDGEPETGAPVAESTNALDNLVSFDDDNASGEDFPTDDLLAEETESNDGHLLSVDDLLGNDVDFSEIDELSDLEVEGTTEAAASDVFGDQLDDLNDFEETLETSFAAPAEPTPTPISLELAETMEAVMATPTPQAAPANDTGFSASPSTGTGDALEGLVRELMAPMIKQWIDQNLPTLVEQRVEQEIQQIATKVVAALRD